MAYYRDEIDWKDLLRKPQKLFGYSYLYVLLLLSALGYAYISNLTVIGKNSVTPVVQKDSAALLQDIPFQSPRLVPPVDVMKVGISTSGMVARGRDLYKANCASCHGDNGMGDGPAGAMLTPAPRNFHSTQGWKNGSKVSQMYKTLQDGIPGSGMASFSYLPPEDRFGVIHYERSLTNGHPEDTPDELRQLDVTYGLSKGMNIAGQMPVKKAMQIIGDESAQSLSRLQGEVRAVDADSTAGALIFRRVASDRQKALASLIHARAGLTGVDAFMKIVLAGPVQDGFTVGAAQLSDIEWALLYQYVQSALKESQQ
jgi:mono/diheme cytochrome c family protein